MKNLKHLVLYLSGNYLGDNEENMKILGDTMKYLSKLEYLELNLGCNHLGKNPLNLKSLGEGMKFLSNNLKLLWLFLDCNDLG